MKHKTRELTGPLLDRAVALAEGHTLRSAGPATYVQDSTGRVLGYINDGNLPGYGPEVYAPSSDWKWGGPIVERELVTFPCALPGSWVGNCGWDEDGSPYFASGSTALVAAMRAYVRSKSGDEVDLP